ncbi:hypothetical protein R1sor_020605 [Riccia sorocarpa]|uniref:Uncharacterized protein n=1 Tax=Riccia sorocarpa TaxID=122646 RepID=A0ABD3GIW4_9MARC
MSNSSFSSRTTPHASDTPHVRDEPVQWTIVPFDRDPAKHLNPFINPASGPFSIPDAPIIEEVVEEESHGTAVVLKLILPGSLFGVVAALPADLKRQLFQLAESGLNSSEERANYANLADELLDRLRPAISCAEQLFLMEIPSTREFLDVLQSAPKARVPGIDGFTYEALRGFWDETDDDFTAMMTTCWLERFFPASMLEGVIKLIPKDLRQETLHHWGRIVHYKLLKRSSYKGWQ